MIARSYYDATSAQPPYPQLAEPMDVDVCVVGGGFAGLSTALGIAERTDLSVVLLEAQRLGNGASGRNGGFVFAGYSLGEQALLRRLGPEEARTAYQLTQQGMALIRKRITNYRLDCDLMLTGVLWANWFRDPRILQRRQELLAHAYGTEWRLVGPSKLRQLLKSERYHGGLVEPDAFHFHPLRYAQGLGAAIVNRGGRVFECSPACAVEDKSDDVCVITPHGRVRARQVVLAGGGYQQRLYPPVSRAIMPIATYVMVTEPLEERLGYFMPTPWAVYDTRFAFDYYRPLNDGRLLWGGRIAAFKAEPASIERKLRRDLARVFPPLAKARVDFAWSGLMGYARHQMPQLGRLGEHIWYAQGFGGHGVSTSNIGGELIARAICEGDETYRCLERFHLSSVYGYAGRVAAQLQYWHLQGRDWLKQRLEF